MSLEIREPRDHELDEVAYTVAYSFEGDLSPEVLEGTRHLYSMLEPLAVFQDGQVVATLGLLPLAIAVNGGSQPFAGVASVACLPEHRRKGYVGPTPDPRPGDDARRRGRSSPACTHPTSPSTGATAGCWPVAALRYSFRPRDIALDRAGRPPGEALRVSHQEWAAPRRRLRRVHRPPQRLPASQRALVAGGGAAQLLRAAPRPPGRGGLGGKDNEWRGYVVYDISRQPDAGPRLRVRDFVALDGDAYVGLRAATSSVTTSWRQLQWWAPVDDPFLGLVDDPEPGAGGLRAGDVSAGRGRGRRLRCPPLPGRGVRPAPHPGADRRGRPLERRLLAAGGRGRPHPGQKSATRRPTYRWTSRCWPPCSTAS